MIFDTREFTYLVTCWSAYSFVRPHPLPFMRFDVISVDGVEKQVGVGWGGGGTDNEKDTEKETNREEDEQADR